VIYPSSALRLRHCFRRDGLAEVIAVLSNPSPDREEEILLDILDDFTVSLNKTEAVTLAEWVPGKDLIVDNFNDNGRIDASPPGFILEKVIGGARCF
jgi:hypothetical protein